jgi:hypothetical protein
MEQNWAVLMTAVFVCAVVGLAFLFPEKGKDAKK